VVRDFLGKGGRERADEQDEGEANLHGSNYKDSGRKIVMVLGMTESKPSSPGPLRLRGATENNLRGVDLDLPLGLWTAVTGPSGSGKTSLVFDTLVKEGQSRYLGSLSARARHFFGKLSGAEVLSLDGLPAAVAVGEASLTGSSRSTVGTLTGALDLLRLLFARTAVDPGGESLARSHFSFNHRLGACEACGGVGLEDQVDPELLVADASKSIRAGALTPTLKSGYTVYSQVTVEVMDEICRAHGFDVDRPWCELLDEQVHVVFFGTKALKVPFGKHGIESRMKWEGITARPREEGYYRGLIPVIEETLKRNRNPNILRFVRSIPCATCEGSRLGRPGREARVGERTLPGLLALPVRELGSVLESLPRSAVQVALEPALLRRVSRLVQLGLGHLTMDRTSPSLSGGEAQRIRLASQLTTGLGGLLIALDEPTLGLHPASQQGMGEVLNELRELGNTLLVVEHDPEMVLWADRHVAMGPGAGVEGGRLLSSGPLDGRPLGGIPGPKSPIRSPFKELRLSGAMLHNLKGDDLVLGLGTFNVVVGPSGAGKSSLVFGTLLPALGGEPGGPFRELTGVPGGKVSAVDARPIGRTPRSTPATWSGLFDTVRKRFAETEAAQKLGFKAGHFSYNNKAGRCPTCEGLGVTRVGLHMLENIELTCADCCGGRFAKAVLDVTWRGRTIAEVLALDVRSARVFFEGDAVLHAMCAAMESLGLGYLSLGQPSSHLSRGEAQRIKLSTLLGTTGTKPTLVLLDEPDRGLHPSDVELLLRAIDALVEAGHTVVAISHHRYVWAAADRLIAVDEGHVKCGVPFAELEPGSPMPNKLASSNVRPAQVQSTIELRGVRTGNLKGVDVTIPHGKLSVLCGVSGSGKTSLAFGTLASESWHRFAESLPFQVRRFVRRMPRPVLDSATGLTPVLSLRQESARTSGRSTVATQSEIGPLLRLLYSRVGRTPGQVEPHGWTAEHFSPDRALGACASCAGRGVVPRCDSAKLITNPAASLLDPKHGAMAGTRPGKFFGERDGQYIATLLAAAEAAQGIAPADFNLPWAELSRAAQKLALDGLPDAPLQVSWAFARGNRKGEHNFEGTWVGFRALVEKEARIRKNARAAAEWAAPLSDVVCTVCGGARLRPEIASVAIGSVTLAQLMQLPLAATLVTLETALEGGADGASAASPGAASEDSAIAASIFPELRARLDGLDSLGLGHLALDRPSATLSDGELQRVRLASILRAGLTSATLVLDEPAAGLHSRDMQALIASLRGACHAGNTVVVVSHRPAFLRAADHLIELGPGAGEAGGELIAAGSPAKLLAGQTPTAMALRAAGQIEASQGAAAIDHSKRTQRADALVIRGARANNLKGFDVELPASGFVAVTGVSGSGKSSLVFDVLGESVRQGRPVDCAGIALPHGLTDHFQVLRDSRDGGGAATPLGELGLMPHLQSLYFGAAQSAGLATPRKAFSFGSPAGRCEACKGAGIERVAMDFMADLHLPCPECGGKRYRPEALLARWRGLDVAEALGLTCSSLAGLIAQEDQAQRHICALRQGLAALDQVGLGYLSLGRQAAELSGGERSRLTLASSLVSAASPGLYLLDEPARGLHEKDLDMLAEVFRRLGDRGDLVVITEHRLSLIARADRVIELGPEGGPGGGRLLG
jgi:excinuclease ABC subunit A